MINGSSYKGQFEKGKKHGLGKEVFLSGLKFKGWFVEGEINGEGKAKNINGTKSEGVFKPDFSSENATVTKFSFFPQYDSIIQSNRVEANVSDLKL